MTNDNATLDMEIALLVKIESSRSYFAVLM